MQRYLRRANSHDKKLIFEWANDPETRKSSFNEEPIVWENHSEWYDKKLRDDNSKIYLLMDFTKPLGVVRVDFNDNEGVISYSVSPDERGYGFGLEEIMLLEKELIENNDNSRFFENGCLTLKAEVKKENIGSKKIFEKLGYSEFEEAGEIIFTKKLSKSDYVFPKEINKKTRDTGFEVLRVISMMMVIVLHYLNKGGLLHTVSEDMSKANLVFWLIESLCLCSVNVYVLISGYYMVNSRFSLTKVINTVFRVLFYSVGITLVMLALGLVEDTGEIFNLYNLTFLTFPISMGHYWFASSYIMLLLISPVLSWGAKKMSKNSLRTCVILLLTLFCFLKSLLPFVTPYDKQGCDLVWFICIYMFAAYIRLHGVNLIKSRLAAVILYVFSAIGIWGYLIMAGLINIRTENKYPNFMERVTDYNFVFVFLSAVGLFLCFRNLKVKLNPFTRLIVRIAPYTFGVYLLHEHILIAHKWIDWFKVQDAYGFWRPVHLIVSVLIIFSIGILVDFIREKLFGVVSDVFAGGLKKHYSKKI